MTERLAALLHAEVHHLEVPVPRVRESLAAGRRVRRRRRVTEVVAVAAVVGVVGAGAAAISGPESRRASDDVVGVAPGTPVDLGAVFADGRRVYLHGGAESVQLDEIAQSMYYTSAGLLVRTNQTGASDGGAPFHFVLIDADGNTEPLELTLGEVVPSTDPRQPYLAYAQTRDDGEVEVVVHDVSTDDDVARVGIGEVATDGWEAPPVALDGDRVYIGTGLTTVIVNWRRGDVSETENLGGGIPTVAGGRALVAYDRGARVVDVVTGEVYLDAKSWQRLSPSGEYSVDGNAGNHGITVHRLDDGTDITVDAPEAVYGWTADDHLLGIADGQLIECPTDGGGCAATSLPAGVDPTGYIRVPGVLNES